jgi:hypothetical protein
MAETGDPSGGVAMQRRRCAACGARFRPRPQIREQRFCSLPDCQRERRRRWKRRKRRTDPDYRDNQARAQRAWCERHRGYWRQYRRRHPQYRERNREQQRLRNGRRGARQTSDVIAKSNASKAPSAEFSGTYVLQPMTDQRIAKGNAWTVKITAISRDIPPMA